MLGIPNYKPQYLINPETFYENFHTQLTRLIGKTIDRFWIMWDDRRNEWHPDGPIIIEIEGINFEFSANECVEFSLTINDINLKEKLDWYDMGDELPLSWKENGNPELIKSLSRPIKEINILTYNPSSEINNYNVDSDQVHMLYGDGFVMHGIEFVLQKENHNDIKNFFSIYNVLDENGIENKEISGYEGIQKIQITSYNKKYN